MFDEGNRNDPSMMSEGLRHSKVRLEINKKNNPGLARKKKKKKERGGKREGFGRVGGGRFSVWSRMGKLNAREIRLHGRCHKEAPFAGAKS